MQGKEKAVKLSETLWEIPRNEGEGMRAPARIYATEKLFREMDDGVIEQITNVTRLPGIAGPAYCMPDGHWGYGFPIGGTAAFDPEEGIISPGGIGFDINCGMRLAAARIPFKEAEPHIERLVQLIFSKIPAGVGGTGSLILSKTEFRTLLEEGSRWCLNRGMAREDDLEKTEESGCMEGADAGTVSDKAVERGLRQVGTLGSGNHYIEIQRCKPENIADKKTAEAFGLTVPDQIVVMVHSGSRGFGHQVATDYLKRFLPMMESKFGFMIKDRELSCAPFSSPEGKEYFSAMKCAVNLAFVNRQVMLHRIREAFSEVFGKGAAGEVRQIYDVTHNTAKLETHTIEGRRRDVIVHRKGATRAFGPGMTGIPEAYRKTGQPVIIGGSMETGSYLLRGTENGGRALFTTAHGSGRVMGRRQAKKSFSGRQIADSMRARGIYVAAASEAGLAEEAGGAYKDIDEVVEAAEKAGLSEPVAKLVPVGNIK
ncbi:MAG: RtcB family protein, partial [Spirochaetia bacterium]